MNKKMSVLFIIINSFLCSSIDSVESNDVITKTFDRPSDDASENLNGKLLPTHSDFLKGQMSDTVGSANSSSDDHVSVQISSINPDVSTSIAIGQSVATKNGTSDSLAQNVLNGIDDNNLLVSDGGDDFQDDASAVLVRDGATSAYIPDAARARTASEDLRIDKKARVKLEEKLNKYKREKKTLDNKIDQARKKLLQAQDDGLNGYKKVLEVKKLNEQLMDLQNNQLEVTKQIRSLEKILKKGK